MRRAIASSSRWADGFSSAGMWVISRSRSLRRSTARPRRMLSALMSVPTAVSMKTGATVSWMTVAISGMCGSYAKPQVYPASAGAGRRGLLCLLLLDLLLLLRDLLLRVLAAMSDQRRGAHGRHADENQRGRRRAAFFGEREHPRVDAIGLVVAALDLHPHPGRAFLLRARVDRKRVVEHHRLRLVHAVEAVGMNRISEAEQRRQRRDVFPCHVSLHPAQNGH